MDRASLTRVVIAVLGLVKLLVEPYGYEIPQGFIDWIADGIAVIAIAWAGWKNNYISQKGRAQQNVLKREGLTK
jgi:SPP1 family holin